MKKIVLAAINAKYIHSNLAVYSLKANAGKYEEDIELAEYTINHQKEEILAGIYRKKPDVVGFSCYIWNIEYVLDVAENLKKICPQVEIILGGPEVSYDAEKVLQRYPFVDLVMVGEGENTFREYAAFLLGEGAEKRSDIAGLCYRKEDGKAVFTAPRMISYFPTATWSRWKTASFIMKRSVAAHFPAATVCRLSTKRCACGRWIWYLTNWTFS